MIELTSKETAYLLVLLAQHLEYYRTLAGSSKCTQQNRLRYEMLEKLFLKLAAVSACGIDS